MLTFGCHSSLNIDFSKGRGANEWRHPQAIALTHGCIAKYRNTPVLSRYLKKNVSMAKRPPLGFQGLILGLPGGEGSGPPNISVCYVINIHDRIAILFFICTLIIVKENNSVTYGAAMKISKMAAWSPPNISICHVINISDMSVFFFHMFTNHFRA